MCPLLHDENVISQKLNNHIYYIDYYSLKVKIDLDFYTSYKKNIFLYWNTHILSNKWPAVPDLVNIQASYIYQLSADI